MLCGSPKLKVAVISPNLKQIIESTKELTPIFESFCHCEHLTVIDLVIAFGLSEQCGAEGDRVPEIVNVFTFL